MGPQGYAYFMLIVDPQGGWALQKVKIKRKILKIEKKRKKGAHVNLVVTGYLHPLFSL